MGCGASADRVDEGRGGFAAGKAGIFRDLEKGMELVGQLIQNDKMKADLDVLAYRARRRGRAGRCGRAGRRRYEEGRRDGDRLLGHCARDKGIWRADVQQAKHDQRASGP